MSKENLSQLALKLLATAVVQDQTVYVTHDGYRKQTAALPDTLKQEVCALVEDVRAIVPNDYAFHFFFDSKGVRLSVEFEDGNTSSDAGGGFFTSRRSMMRKMRAIDWDGQRAELIQKGGIFDEMVSAADDRPANIPSSELAAQKYGTRLVAEIGKNRRLNPRSAFTLIIARDDLGIASEQLSSREELLGLIGDRMTTGNDILMVLEECAQWTFEAIEAAKLEAVEGLGPISRAKAERRFMV